MRKWSPWAHRELTVVTAPGPNDHGSVTPRLGHSSVTARSQLNHGEVTAGCEHLQYDHGSVTARSQLNHGPGHGWLWPFWSLWAHGELKVSSHGAQFFSHGLVMVKTGFVVGSLVKWLPIKVAQLYKSDTIWVVYCSLIANGSIRL